MKNFLLHIPFSLIPLFLVMMGGCRNEKRIQESPVSHRSSFPSAPDSLFSTKHPPISLSFFGSSQKDYALSGMIFSWQNWGNLLLLSLIFLLLFLLLRTRQQYLQFQAKLNALQAQINPHFISNSLNAIESLINLNKRDEAARYLIHFSRLSTYVLNGWRKASSNLFRELQNLDHFLALEELRFRNKLTYEISVSPGLNTRFIEVPFLVLQPYVEKAIWHGIKPLKRPGILTIFVQQIDNELVCSIEDNGIGRQKSRELHANSALREKSVEMERGHGSTTRLKSVKGVKLSVADLKNDQGKAIGTRVELRLPIKQIKHAPRKSRFLESSHAKLSDSQGSSDPRLRP